MNGVLQPTGDTRKDILSMPDRQLSACKFCEADGTGRNLILSFDGTSNQYGEKVYLIFIFILVSFSGLFFY
jgi:uncharacterized protein (DUF2235 family)